MMKVNRMYHENAKSWGVFAGCRHHCFYCSSSFQRQMKRQKQNCKNCYDFVPHFHPERLNNPQPRTPSNNFIFVGSSGDLAFCRPKWMHQILERIEQLSDRTFLIQTKNPASLRRYQFPKNVLLGTTLETDRADLYKEVSRAPNPTLRYYAMLDLEHPKKVVTIEPVIDFNLDVMKEWVREIRPQIVYVGFDSGRNFLPEPPLQKVKVLMKRLREFTCVRAKLLRRAWWEI